MEKKIFKSNFQNYSILLIPPQPIDERILQDSIPCVLPPYTNWRFTNRMNKRTKK